MSCYCSATSNPPCGWCERTYECEVCGELRNKEDCNFEIVNGVMCCEYCVEEVDTKNKCTCPIVQLMNTGCKCGGA